MAFTVTDFADLTRLLAERPEWQAELRSLILSEDLLALPVIVGELAEAQRELAEARAAHRSAGADVDCAGGGTGGSPAAHRSADADVDCAGGGTGGSPAAHR